MTGTIRSGLAIGYVQGAPVARIRLGFQVLGDCAETATHSTTEKSEIPGQNLVAGK
jgi:hypothetical protein